VEDTSDKGVAASPSNGSEADEIGLEIRGGAEARAAALRLQKFWRGFAGGVLVVWAATIDSAWTANWVCADVAEARGAFGSGVATTVGVVEVTTEDGLGVRDGVVVSLLLLDGGMAVALAFAVDTSDGDGTTVTAFGAEVCGGCAEIFDLMF
jgi:hypothetical protein